MRYLLGADSASFVYQLINLTTSWTLVAILLIFKFLKYTLFNSETHKHYGVERMGMSCFCHGQEKLIQILLNEIR